MGRPGFASIVGCLAALGFSCGGTGVMPPPETKPLCIADLAVTGTLAASAPPVANQGCQADGTWTVNVGSVLSCGSDDDCPNATCNNSMCSSCMTIPDANQAFTIVVAGMAHGSGGATETITHTHGSGEDDALEINGEDDRCNGSFDLIIADGGKFDDIEMQPSTPAYCVQITCSASALCANAGDVCQCPGAGSNADSGADCTSPGFCVGSDGSLDCGSGSITTTTITLAGSAEYQLFAVHP